MMEFIKYQLPDYTFVSEKEFWEKIKEFCDDPKLNASHITFEDAKETLVQHGKISFLKEDKERRSWIWNTFFMADEEVFDMCDVIANIEYDPLDGDCFNIAFEIHKAGWRKK